MWNYRVVRTIHKEPDSTEYVEYTIHETYYNEDGSVAARTVDPMYPYGETVEELKKVLERMLLALDKPVIESTDEVAGFNIDLSQETMTFEEFEKAMFGDE